MLVEILFAKLKIFGLILHIQMCTGAAWVSVQHEFGFFLSLYKVFNAWIFKTLGSLDRALRKDYKNYNAFGTES